MEVIHKRINHRYIYYFEHVILIITVRKFLEVPSFSHLELFFYRLVFNLIQRYLVFGHRNASVIIKRKTFVHRNTDDSVSQIFKWNLNFLFRFSKRKGKSTTIAINTEKCQFGISRTWFGVLNPNFRSSVSCLIREKFIVPVQAWCHRWTWKTNLFCLVILLICLFVLFANFI